MLRTKEQMKIWEMDLYDDDDWTFKGVLTRKHTHCYHDYPARMIPQVANKILNIYGKNAKLVFDPFCGSGTSLVESTLHDISAIGTDLNPLARLIAKAKTTIVNCSVVSDSIDRISEEIHNYKYKRKSFIEYIPKYERLEYWFKPEVIDKLAYLKRCILEIEDANVRQFFMVVFSETVRESSNSRKEEFKIYRYEKDKLRLHNPDPFTIFLNKSYRNLNGLKSYVSMLKNLNFKPDVKVESFNTVEGIPDEIFSGQKVDMVLTSPPYGDSRTTVAYGQYSKFSSIWLDIYENFDVDSVLLGGKLRFFSNDIPSVSLERIFAELQEKDKVRAQEVFSFYYDLYCSIKNVSRLVKANGYACFVVGNRKVKNLILPTDSIIRELFESEGFDYITTHKRSIPSKRMPLKNSPSNVTGQTNDTMTREYIVVMKKSI